MANTHPYGWQFIDRKDASASASLDFTFPSGIDTFKLVGIGLVAATDDVEPWLRISTSSTFNSGASDYQWILVGNREDGSSQNNASGADSALVIGANTGASNAVGNAATEQISFDLMILNALSTSLYTSILGSSWAANPVGNRILQHVGGDYVTAEANDGVQFLFESGNITSGTIVLFGLKIPGS